jgi:type I restriction enzyme M protein
MCYPGSKPKDRKGKVLFINADAEYRAGRAQSYLRPEDIEKIVTTYDEFRNVPSYATVVTREKLEAKENDWNLNIRRYVDNTPPIEIQDVRAHLFGGIPHAEIKTKINLLTEHGLSFDDLFVSRTIDAGYCDFIPVITERRQIASFITEHPAVQARESQLREIFNTWWSIHQKKLRELPATQTLAPLRSDFLSSFNSALASLNFLSRYEIAGVIAAWWYESKYDLKALVAQGFTGLIDSWIDSIRSELEEPNGNGKKQDMLHHKLIAHLLPEYLEEIADTEARIAEFEQRKESFESGEGFAEEGEEETDEEEESEDKKKRNHALELEQRLEILNKKISKKSHRSQRQKRKQHGDQSQEEKIQNLPLFVMTSASESEIVASEQELASIYQEIADLEHKLKPYWHICKQLQEAQQHLRELKKELVKRMLDARSVLSQEQCEQIVVNIAFKEINTHLESKIVEHRQSVVATVENWWDKYHITLLDIQQERENKEQTLNTFLRTLGYA